MKLKMNKYLLGLFFLLGIIQQSIAQFSITESFRNSYTETATEIGGDAILTGNGSIDPKGDGWLRLTPAAGNKRGFAYVNKSFPSTQGVIVEFDYKTWGGNGADGFVVYLFDAKYGPTGTNVFATGGFGGSLGYAQQNGTPGLTGGYIGVGFDEYGNFAKANEGKVGGTSGTTSNFISVRGKTPNYSYLNGKSYSYGIAASSTSSRPADGTFYRRVKIKIEPLNSIYRITVYVKRSISGNFEEQFVYDYAEAPYANMKLGFAASTGGNHNYHEIRNVITTTPGGLRVFKSVDKNLVSTANANDENKVTYTINVTNDSNFQLSNVAFEDIIKDGEGNQLTTSQFLVESITLSNFSNNTSSLLTNNNNKITGNLGLAPNTEGKVVVTGRLLQVIPGRKLKNEASAYTTDLTETDLTNNISSVTTNLIPPVIGSADAFEWLSTSSGRTYTILANDLFEGGAIGSGFISSGSSKNVTITPKGTWPTGITINSSGQIAVAQGTSRPTTPIYYTICNNNNECVDVEVIFNTLDAGTITLPNNVICYGESVIVNKGTTFLSTYYTWQASYDNGVTWADVSDKELALTHKDLTIPSLQADTWIRRKAEPILGGIGYSSTVFIKVIHNELTYSTSNTFSVAVNTPVTIPNIQTTYPSKITILDKDNNEVQQGAVVSFANVGSYTYSVKVEKLEAPTCPVYASIDIHVYDLGKCEEVTEKVMVTSQDWSTVPVLIIPGWVYNEDNAKDNDLSTYSTIGIPVGLLGLGTTWQNLRFNHTVSKGTPVTVKIGQEYSAVQVGGGITIQALDVNGNTVGPLLAAGDGALLDLLVGDNVFEYTFVPKNSSGALIDYKGVRVVLGSTVAVANNAKVFGAYYNKTKVINLANPSCNTTGKVVAGAAKPSNYPHTNVTLNPMVDDVLWGVEDIGLGVASSLASVVHPYLAADNDLNTFATFNKAVAALNRQKLTVKFNQVARPGDQIRILMGGFEVPVLDLSLLTDIKIQRYLGDVKVGPVVNGSQFKILDLNLLALLGTTGNRKALIVDAIAQPFDRVEMTYLSTVQVGLLGDYTYVYDISVMPKLGFDGQDPNDPYGSKNPIKLCALDYLKIQKPDACTNYEIGFAYATKDTDGNIISFTDSTPSGLQKVSETDSLIQYEFTSIHGEHRDNLFLKVRIVRQGCPYGEYQYLRIKLENCNDAIVNPVLKLGANK